MSELTYGDGGVNEKEINVASSLMPSICFWIAMGKMPKSRKIMLMTKSIPMQYLMLPSICRVWVSVTV